MVIIVASRAERGSIVTMSGNVPSILEHSPITPTEQPPLTFEKHDLLGSKPFCERLERYLLVEHEYVEGSLVIALDGGFGSGKSTFIDMWRSDLIARRQQGQFCPMPIDLNAWESDYCGDPLVAILSGLLQAVAKWEGKDAPENPSSLKKAAKDVAWFATGLANSFAAKATGFDFVKATELAAKKKASRKPVVPDFIALYEKRKEALDILRSRLTESFGGAAPKVLVFVDELDRCRPDYAVTYLETIKHVFNVNGMIFVLAIDQPHLATSAKTLYGADLDFPEYFRKFCHRTIPLPQPGVSEYNKMSFEYAKRYVAVEGRRLTRLPGEMQPERRLGELAAAFRLRPRQLQEVFRICGHVLATERSGRGEEIAWSTGALTMLLGFIKLADSKLFSGIANATLGPDVLVQALISKFGSKHAEWWVQVYLGHLLAARENRGVVEELMSIHFGYDSNAFHIFTRSQFVTPWQIDQPVQKLCQLLESVDSFSEL